MTTLSVTGMTCASCSLSVKKAAEQKGATQVYADVAKGAVSFTSEEAQVAAIAAAIRAAGYGVKEGSADAQEIAQEHRHAQQHENRLLLICALLTAPLLAHMALPWPLLHAPLFQLALAVPVYGIGLYAFGRSAFNSLLHGSPNMNVLILLGATAAFAYSVIGLSFFSKSAHQYLFFETAASIITLVLAGNWLEHRTARATTSAIDALAKLQPQKARLLMRDSIGKETILEVDAAHLRAGDVVLVAEGDALPADGNVLAGTASMNEQMLTGESDLVKKEPGSEVTGGTLVAQGNLQVWITATGEATALAGIIRLVREAQANRPPLQLLADKISAVFVPAVLAIALLTFGFWWWHHGILSEAMMRSIAVLVVACPCAMGIATPAAIAVGLGRAARNGILVKGGDTLERLKTIRQIAFDKTGTLTTGQLSVTRYEVSGMEDSDFKGVIASLEKHSTHPIAKSILLQWPTAGELALWQSVNEEKGKGISGTDREGNVWRLGSGGWLAAGQDNGWDVYLFENEAFRGGLQLQDALRDDAASTIAALRQQGYHTILLSGDRKEKCSAIAAAAGIDEFYAEQSPADKQRLLNEWKNSKPTAMVGDGINDAPSLAAATVGISLSSASQIAIQSAQVILSANRLGMLPKALRLGILTEETIRSNLWWAFAYNIVAIPFAAAGYLSPTWGAGIMALSDVVLALNSLRLAVRKA